MHCSDGDVAEDVGVAAVQPKTRQRTELGGVIQEVEREQACAGCDGEQPLETHRRWMRHRQINPSHGQGSCANTGDRERRIDLTGGRKGRIPARRRDERWWMSSDPRALVVA